MGPTHTVYIIKATGPDGANWTIEKRYREIRALHDQLSRVRGRDLPNIPPKRIFGNKDPDFVQSRQAALQQYFSELTLLERSTRSPAFAQFLAEGGDPGSEDAALAAAIGASLGLRPGAGHGGARAGELAAIRAALGAADTEDAMLQRALNASRSDQDEILRRQQEEELQESLEVDRQRELQEEAERQREAADSAERAHQARREEEEREGRRRSCEEARQRLPPEPEPGEAGRVDVQVRARSGQRLRRAFRDTDALARLYDFTLAESGEDLARQTYQLVEAMPRRVYANDEQSLGDAGLRGQCALLVEVL